MNRSAVGFGTLGGWLAGLFPAFVLGDILKTILMAGLGAVVSFFVSLFLGHLMKKKR